MALICPDGQELHISKTHGKGIDETIGHFTKSIELLEPILEF
jgi:hypothetical protein